MAEKMVDKVRRLMVQPARIRNIATVAHIDHGKCIKGDARMLMFDGSVVAASDLFEKLSQDGKIVKETSEEIVYAPAKESKVFSLNKEQGIIECKNIQYAWKLSGGKLIKVKVRNGFEISTTPEHKYIVLEDMEFKDKEAVDLKIGDRIVCARNIKSMKSTNIKAKILEKLAKGSFYVHVKPALIEDFKRSFLQKDLNSDSNIKKRSIYHGAWQGRYRIKDFMVIAERQNYSLEEYYECIDNIYYMQPNGKSSIKVSLPDNMEDLFFLAGLMIGDGTGNRFVVGKKELDREFTRICNSLGFEPVKRNYPGKTPELCTNKTVEEMLRSIFDYPVKMKSHNVRVSSILQQAPDECISSFLKAYFDCDGTVERSRSAISLTSVSSQMLKDLQMLLLKFGILSIRQQDTIYISGDSAKVFVREIGFLVSEKKAKAEYLIKKSIGSYALDTIPLSDEKLAKMRKVPMAQLG